MKPRHQGEGVVSRHLRSPLSLDARVVVGAFAIGVIAKAVTQGQRVQAPFTRRQVSELDRQALLPLGSREP